MTKLVNYTLPIFFFLLPWQTRWIFSVEDIAGDPTQFGILSLYAVQLVLLLVMLLSGPPKISKRTKVPRMLVLVLIGVVIISSFGTMNPGVSAVQVMHLVLAMLLFFALMDERVSLPRMMSAFVYGLAIPSVLGIVQFFTGTSAASTVLGLAARDALQAGDAVIQTGEGVRWLRAYGSFPHPNMFGGYLAVGLVAIFGLWDYAKNISEKSRLAMMAILLSFALILTFSRSAWLGLVLAVIVGAVVLYVKRTSLARVLVIPVAALFIGGIFFASFSGVALRPGSDTEFESRSINERIQQYSEYSEVLGNNWVIGSGIGTYSFAYADAFPGKEVWEYQPIHNVFLLVIAEIGIIGAIAVLLWSSSIDRLNFGRFPNRDAVTAFMMGNVILVVLFFDHYLWSTWAGLALVAFVMALTVRMGEE